MPKVAEQGLQAKLQKLSGSQPSIESVTEYCLFYYEDAQRVVAIWQQELQKARPERKLALVWVANHILLTAHRAKGQAALQAYQAAFSHAMPKAVTHCMQQGDEKLLKGVTRTVNVWEERKVFSSKHIKQLKDIVSGAGAAGPAAAAAAGGGGLPSTSSRGANGTAPSSSTAQLQQLGPVGEWLTSVHRNTQTTSEEQQKFSGSFTPDLLTSGKLPDVSAASTRLHALTAALAAEKAARAALVAAMQSEIAEQVSSIQALQQRIEAAQGQQLQLEGRMGQLTEEMSRAVAGLAGLGALLQPAAGQANGGDADPDLAGLLQSEEHQQQQQQGGLAGASPQAPAAEPLGSPQAPDMELEVEEEDEDYLAGYPPTAAAAAAGGGGTHVDPAAQAGQQQLLATLQGLPDQYQQQMQDLMASGLFTGAVGAPGLMGGGPLQAAAPPVVLGGLPMGGLPGGAPAPPPAAAAAVPGMGQYGGMPAAGGMPGQYMGVAAAGGAADEEDEPYDPADD